MYGFNVVLSVDKVKQILTFLSLFYLFYLYQTSTFQSQNSTGSLIQKALVISSTHDNMNFRCSENSLIFSFFF